MSLHGHLSRTCVATGLKRPTWNRRAALCSFAVLLRMGFTWLPVSPQERWSLEPPFHPYLSKTGGIFLLHCPWSYLRRPLAGILPCEARTFLPHSLSAICASGHVIYLSEKYSTTFQTLKQLPPINSRISEVFAISSAGIGRK